jgi:hypothetical protein
MTDQERNPAVLIPYPGASADTSEQDIFVYLRPESNGVLVESTMLKVIERNPNYKKQLFLVYLANLPGEFIFRNHITEDHYPTKMKFAALGAKIFTDAMRNSFSRHFGVDFSRAKIIGSFEALRILATSPEDLFNIWVSQEDILLVNGQTIKKIGDYYVINCDIPELVDEMKYRETNIAVMIFRTALGYKEFEVIIKMMENALLDANILLPEWPSSRIFHYSKGPFEQVLDGLGYLYSPEADHIPLSDLPFPRFLASRSLDFSVLWGLMRNPLVRYAGADGVIHEDNIFSYTQGDSYEEAWEKIFTIRSQVLLPSGKRDQGVGYMFGTPVVRETPG